MEEMELTSVRLLVVGWLIFWRGLAGWSVRVMVIGVVALEVFSPISMAAPIISRIMGADIILTGLIWWPLVLRMALRKQYRDFRIALLPRNAQVSVFD